MFTVTIKGKTGRPRKDHYDSIEKAWIVFSEYARMDYEVTLHDETYDIEVTA